MVVRQTTGPDLVIAGAARSGTSYLASILSAHPSIDAGAVKEPNYFSREFGRGAEWYDGLYRPQQPDLSRLDASVSYTFKHFPDALSRLAAVAPDAFVVYAVREPIARAHSHYVLHRDYFGQDSSPDFGTALRHNPVYAGASDYTHWLSRLNESFPVGQVLVVPFPVITANGAELANRIFRMIGVEEILEDVTHADAHRNDVVEFRHGVIRHARRLVKRSGAYPWLRRTLGAKRLRTLRSRATRQAARESLAVALESCDAQQLQSLQHLYTSGQSAVSEELRAQDQRLALDWTSAWTDTVPEENSSLLSTALGRVNG